MSWLLFALLAALSESFKSLVSKQSLREVSPYWVALSACAIPIPLLLGWLIISPSSPSLGPNFFPALVVGGSLNVWALYVFMRALRDSDLSVSVPFIAFTPIFLLATSPVLVGDVPTLQDVLGILCIVCGAYTLHIRLAHQHLWAPFQAIARQAGPRRMLLVAVIYSVSSNFDKIGVQQSSPLVWALAITTFMTLGYLGIFRWLTGGATAFTGGPRFIGMLFLIGLFQGIGLIVHNHAMSIGPVPSVIAVKRSSILFASIWGFMFLREGHARERLSGVLLMVLGVGIMAMGEG